MSSTNVYVFYIDELLNENLPKKSNATLLKIISEMDSEDLIELLLLGIGLLLILFAIFF